MIRKKLSHWIKNFSSLTVELEYHSILGFGYSIEFEGERFFLTKNKIQNQSMIEVHSFQGDTTVQSHIVPEESSFLALRLIDRIENSSSLPFLTEKALKNC